MSYQKQLSILVSTICIFLLQACGGSGDQSPPVISSPQAPVEPPVSTPVTPPVDTPTDPGEGGGENQSAPNILFIISDDQGIDASSQYAFSDDLPFTPTIDQLANAGVVFDNAWATPACTTTRATIITGKYGFNSGVTFVPAVLSDEHQILQSYINENSDHNYASAVFGKWHLGGGGNGAVDHPNTVGVDYYAGNVSNVSDYNNWSLTINGETQTSTEYHTTAITNLAIDWIEQQTTPWFTWLAYSAPHSPFHLPPSNLHTRTLSGTDEDIAANPRDYYLSAIEAMDTEIGRLLVNLPEQVRDNTVIIFMGDNGTPRRIIDTTHFASTHAKGSLYEGGVAVPLVVSGKGVTRQGERESLLVNAA